MSLETWLLFCVTETVLCLTPGPAVLLVVSLTLRGRAPAGLRGALGVLLANAFYFMVSATGLAAVLLASYEVFFLIKWVGAAYLVWLGLKALLGPRRAAPTSADVERVRSRAFTHGFLTQSANPKLIVFFTALLPQFIDPAGAVGMQVAVLGLSSLLIELAVLVGYVALTERGRRMVSAPRLGAVLQRAGGLLLIGAGAGLATLRRAVP